MKGDEQVAGPERVVLAGFLDHLRATLEASAQDLTDEEVHRRHPDLGISMASLFSHLAFQEDYWFRYVWSGLDPSAPWQRADWGPGGDWDWRIAGELSGEELRALWREAVERSLHQELCGDLDGAAARPVEGGPVSRRWVMLHMIEEYARHCGHADALRAAIDDVVVAEWRSHA